MKLFFELIAAFFATAAFCAIFNTPKKQWIFGGLTGSIGWLIYRLFSMRWDIVAGSFAAAVAIMLLARILLCGGKPRQLFFLLQALFRSCPVSVFMIRHMLCL